MGTDTSDLSSGSEIYNSQPLSKSDANPSDAYQNLTATKADPEKQPVVEPKPDPETAPPRAISGFKWALVVVAIYSSQFLFALDNTIVANIQPVIVEHFDSVAKLSWISVSFLIGSAGTNLIWGKVYAQFNAKWTYIICVAVFEVGSAVCGAAPSIDAFIIARAICGVSGAGMYIGLMTLLAVTTTIQERPMYVSGAGFTWGLGTVLGPIIGGAFTDSSVGWRWSFYINLFIGAVCAPVYLVMLPSDKDPRPGVSFLDRARELDYIGGTLLTGAFVSGIMAVSFGGVMFPWNSGKIIGLFVCSGVLFILLGIQQTHTIFTTVVQRIFPVEFFKMPTILTLFASTAAGGTALFVPIYMAPLFFQFTRGDSALESGVRLLPFIFIMIFAVIANGAVLSKYGLYMPWYLAGGIFVVIGAALMYTVDLSTSVSHIYGYTVLIGFGVGMFSQTSFSVAQALVEPQMVSAAVGFISCAQITGIALSLAISNAVFLNKSEEGIKAILPDIPTAEIEQTIAGARSTLLQSLSPSVKEKVLAVIVDAQNNAYILVMTAGALVVLLSLTMKREKLFMEASAGGA